MSYKHHFSRFIEAAPRRLHLAAHSHHYWPDVSFEAHQQSWLDAAKYADRKWEHIVGTLWPTAQQHIARILNTGQPDRVVFATSTHALVTKIFSCFPISKKIRVLTTDSEFHSFSRQLRRLEEEGIVEAERIPTLPLKSFTKRMCAAAQRGDHDLVFFSQVFFNSGYEVRDFKSIVDAVPNKSTFVVIDGYHGFLALPTDISTIQDRAFYIAGSYKYAMAGEGACFMHAPPKYGPRPRDTGWYADFDGLPGSPQALQFPENAARFRGATFDQTALYRFNAVMKWMIEEKLSPQRIHEHVHAVQEEFLEALGAANLDALKIEQLLVPRAVETRGHFLTFLTPRANEIQLQLQQSDILTDARGDRLRFGFSLYHDPEEAPQMVARIAAALQ